MPVSEDTFQRVALEDLEGHWELTPCGDLRRKPGMVMEHNDAARLLAFLLQQQLPIETFTVAFNSARLALPGGGSFIPDVVVAPTAVVASARGRTSVESYDEPMPLVVEVWSPSTGEYDVTDKLEGYRQRGDSEIWLLHPVERSLTAWTHAPGGSYTEAGHTTGEVRPTSLFPVVIRLASLFRFP